MSDRDSFRRHMRSDEREDQKDRPYCKTCYEKEGLLKRAVFSQHRGGWICEEGHLNQDVMTLP